MLPLASLVNLPLQLLTLSLHVAKPMGHLQRQKKEDSVPSGAPTATPAPSPHYRVARPANKGTPISNAPQSQMRFAPQLGLTRVQMLSGKEKRNQQAELSAVKSLMATHASAASAAQERCAAAEAEVLNTNLAARNCLNAASELSCNGLYRCSG